MRLTATALVLALMMTATSAGAVETRPLRVMSLDQCGDQYALALAPGAELALSARADDPDRGDVPGWVMLTLMSAVLVAGLLLVAQPALEGLFQDAMARVSQN